MGLLGNYEMQGFVPADETLLFRQKCPKPFPPVCGPKGVPPPTPRITWRENSLRSNNLRQVVDSGLRLRRIRRRGCSQKKRTPKKNSNFSGFSDRAKHIRPVISSLTRNLESGRTTDFSIRSKLQRKTKKDASSSTILCL